MSATGFVSDLHLCETRPHTTRLFLEFLTRHAPRLKSLYIIGDLFEYWAGDDDLEDPHHRQVIEALHQLSDDGTRVFLMHGNRDFLIGDAFSRASGVQLITDPLLLDLNGRRALITHGDGLCTDDVEYQKFRAQVRDSSWQVAFLALSLAQRKAHIVALRQRSELEKSGKTAAIMDVNSDAVVALLRAYDFPELLIHGHTHRPGRHDHHVDGRHCERIVLSDWDTEGSYLHCDASVCSSIAIS